MRAAVRSVAPHLWANSNWLKSQSWRGILDAERWTTLSSVEIPINLVLIVEDDTDAAEMIKSMLERQGIEVRVAKEGGAGSSYIRHAEAGLRHPRSDAAR